jgi:hypothetical protein
MSALLSKVVVRSMKLPTLARVLKIDYKGCEYGVVDEDDILKLLDIVEIKYNGCYRDEAYRNLGVLWKT